MSKLMSDIFLDFWGYFFFLSSPFKNHIPFLCLPPALSSMIHFSEDEQQQKNLSCTRSVRQLTMERDQAVADLSSVERSFADLFRRYENMKEVLEGYKKVSISLAGHCAAGCGRPDPQVFFLPVSPE